MEAHLIDVPNRHRAEGYISSTQQFQSKAQYIRWHCVTLIVKLAVDGESTTRADSLSQVSVVVAGRNRRETLRLCLNSILSSSERPAEVIYVYTGSCGAFVEDISREFPTVAVMTAQGGNPQDARNLGAEKTRSEWILFCDDDVVLEHDAIERMFKIARTHERVGLIGGRRIISKGQLPSSDGFSSYCIMSAAWLPREGTMKVWNGPLLVYAVRNIYLVRRWIFERIGGWCSTLFIQFDEVYLSAAVNSIGYDICCVFEAEYEDLNDRRSILASAPIPELGITRNALGIRNALYVAAVSLPYALVLVLLPALIVYFFLRSVFTNTLVELSAALRSFFLVAGRLSTDRLRFPHRSTISRLMNMLKLVSEKVLA